MFVSSHSSTKWIQWVTYDLSQNFIYSTYMKEEDGVVAGGREGEAEAEEYTKRNFIF